MSQPSEQFERQPRDARPTTRTWVLWGLWRALLLGISAAGFVLGEGSWRWVWLALLVVVLVTTWFSRPGRTASVAPALREPGDHRVILQVPGDRPVPVIRALRRITGADLVTAKNLLESAPVIVVENLSQESAAQAAHLLTAAGARATVVSMDTST